MENPPVPQCQCWAHGGQAGGRAAAVLPPRALRWNYKPGSEGRRRLISWFSDSEDARQRGRESLRLDS